MSCPECGKILAELYIKEYNENAITKVLLTVKYCSQCHQLYQLKPVKLEPPEIEVDENKTSPSG
jgi:hypothetical protein